jgi:hypothetical protein
MTHNDDEEDQAVVQTRYGYIRGNGMMRAIFAMWPTAAKKRRIHKLLNDERTNMNDKKGNKKPHDWRMSTETM